MLPLISRLYLQLPIFPPWHLMKMEILVLPSPPPPKTCSFHSFPHLSKRCHYSLAFQVPIIAVILDPFLSFLFHRQIHQSILPSAAHINERNWWMLWRKIRQGVGIECTRRKGRLEMLFVNHSQGWTLQESDIKTKTFLKYRKAQAPAGSEEEVFWRREEWPWRLWGAQRHVLSEE